MRSATILLGCAVLIVGATEIFAQPESKLDLSFPPPRLDGSPIQLFPWTPPADGTTPVAPYERAVLSADSSALVAGNNRFALNIYQHLAAGADSDKNLLLSPFSISSALGMTHAGARGRTADEMAAVLGFSLPDERLHPAFGELMRDLTAARDGYQLSIANRLFGQAGYPFKQPFLDTTGRDYGAPLEALNYRLNPEAARLRINDWVEDQTHDKIRGLLPAGSVKENTRLALVNAVYFNGSWKSKFEESFTREEPFHGADGSQSQVELMHQTHSFGYADRDGFKMLEMPYSGDDLSMVLMLPDRADGLSALEASLTPGLLDDSLASMWDAKVNVSLPKFTFDSSFSLKSVLEEMGVRDAFNEGAADLTGIADPWDEKLYIDKALHKAFIDVNEEGTEAAAATAIIVGAVTTCFCPPPPPKEFRADHPFLFALRDRHSGSLLFLGRVVRPEELARTSSASTPEPASLVMLAVGLLLLAINRRTWPSHSTPLSL